MRPWHRDPTLVAYIGLTLILFWRLADHYAPVEGTRPPLPDLSACQIGYVYDGDTVELLCGTRGLTARLVGYDTPETKEARCPQERQLGERATLRLRALVGQGAIRLTHEGHDKYGRELVRLWVNGRDVAESLTAEALAVRYDGGARIDWCARLKAN